MPTRIENLEAVAQPVAKMLHAEGPTIKRLLSAGVLALKDCTLEERSYYYAKAVGVEIPRPDSLETQPRIANLDELRRLLQAAAKEATQSPKTKHSSRAQSG